MAASAIVSLAVSCNKASLEQETTGGGDISAKLIPITIKLDVPQTKATATAEESKINRVTVITYKVPTNVSDRTDPTKYLIGSFADFYQDGMSQFTISVAPGLFDIYMLVNLPNNNLFGDMNFYPVSMRFTQANMSALTSLPRLLEKRIHVRSQQSQHVDYNGLTMTGQLYSIDPASNPTLTVGLHRLAAKVVFTTTDNSDVFHYINAQSFINVATESPIVPNLPGDRSTSALATYNAPSYCPDLAQTSFYAVSNLHTYNLQYAAEKPAFVSPDANNLIPVKNPDLFVDQYYVDELRYSNEALLNSQTCTNNFYILQNRAALYATRATVRIIENSELSKFLSVKINDGTNGAGSSDLVGRNRVYNINMTFNGTVSNYVTNPWDYTYRTKTKQDQERGLEVTQSSQPW